MNTNLNNELTNNILLHTENINNMTDIDTMVDLKNNIFKNISLYYKNIEELRNLINLIDNKLMNKCTHQWKRDYSYYGEHSQYICSLCGLYN